jgi:hypothetical protein
MECILVALTSPYYLIFGRITRKPIDYVLSGQPNVDVKANVESWLKLKQKHAIYTQVAVGF